MKHIILFFMMAATIAAGDITISKDSLRVYNNPISSYADGIMLVNHAMSAVHLDSAFILFDDFDTTGSGKYGLDGRLQAQWKERNSPVGYTYWNLEKTGGSLYNMTQQISAASNPVPLGFTGLDDSLQIVMMEIGTCLGCSGLPTWYPPFVKGKMELRFSSGQTLFIKLYSDDRRNPAVMQPCASYQCDSMVVRKILDENNMADVPVGSFSTRSNDRIISLQLKFNLAAAVSLPKQLTKLSSEIGRLSALQQLDFSGNKLDTLPGDIGRLGNLVILIAGRNILSVLPDSITRCTKLTHLILDNNQIKNLPDSLYKLRSLKQLSVTRNKLSDLPPNIEKLDSLQFLYIIGNSICTLPDQVIAWKKKLPMYLSSLFEPEWPDSQSCGETNINFRHSNTPLVATSIIRRIVQEKGAIVICTGVGVKSISLFDAAGRVVARQTVLAMQQGFSTFRLNTSSLRGGVYYLCVETDKRSGHRKGVQMLSVGVE